MATKGKKEARSSSASGEGVGSLIPRRPLLIDQLLPRLWVDSFSNRGMCIETSATDFRWRHDYRDRGVKPLLHLPNKAHEGCIQSARHGASVSPTIIWS